jgi:hypothetical protein
VRNERGQEEVVVWCYDTTANKVQRLILIADMIEDDRTEDRGRGLIQQEQEQLMVLGYSGCVMYYQKR